MKKEWLIRLSIIVLLGFISLWFLDTLISSNIDSIRGFIPDLFFLGFTFEMQTFVVLFFLTSLFLFHEHKRRWILPLWLSAAMAIILSYVLKVGVARPRPFQTGIIGVSAIAQSMLGASVNTWNLSFPSFQAVLAFSAIPLLSKEFPRFKWVWFAIACIIAFSRVYFGVHWASDVIFGGLIGYLIGWIFVKVEEKYKFGEKLIRKLRLSK